MRRRTAADDSADIGRWRCRLPDPGPRIVGWRPPPGGPSPTVLAGIIESWDPSLRRGRIRADDGLYHFTAGDFFALQEVGPRPRLAVDFVPIIGVRTRDARQVRVRG